MNQKIIFLRNLTKSQRNVRDSENVRDFVEHEGFAGVIGLLPPLRFQRNNMDFVMLRKSLES